MTVVRRGTRFLVPLALVATVVAVYLIVHSGLSATRAATTSSAAPLGSPVATSSSRAVSRTTRTSPAVYVVRPGDTLSAIAAKTGVSMAKIEALNPTIKPNALLAGQKLRLRQG